MSPAELVKLIHSLSGPEKRFFKLQCKSQGGEKEYETLFNLIDAHKGPDIAGLKKLFKKKSPDGSWENSCSYLGSMVIGSLVRSRKEKDVYFDLMHQLQEIRILSERSLGQQALRQAEKVRKKAAEHQLHWIEYSCARYELQHHSDNNFSGVSDDHLVKLQMRGKDILRSLNHIHDHYSLYELLHHRLLRAGRIISEEDKKRLNDLMLSEITLVAGRAKSFVSKKLHLLFQSFFFTVVGDYHSALKSFYQLNELMEKNEMLLDNPPLDYLSALSGILDSLHMLDSHLETGYYLQKLKRLDQPHYPEYFRYLVRKTSYIQELNSCLRSGDPAAAKRIAESIPKDVFSNYALADEEKQCELYFYCTLAHFRLSEWKKAHLYIREITNRLKLPPHLMVSKAIRLLDIVIYFQKDESVHLEYQVRSYKRYFRQSKLLQAEKLIFRIIGDTGPRIRLLPAEKKKLLQAIDGLENEKYEQQLLKYLDVAGWARRVIDKR